MINSIRTFILVALGIFLLLAPGTVFGQDSPVIQKDGENTPPVRTVPQESEEMIITPPPGHPQEQQEQQRNQPQELQKPTPGKTQAIKQRKQKQAKKKSTEKVLVAENKKEKLRREFKKGEKIKYLTPTDKHVQKGVIDSITNQFIIVDGRKIKVADLELVGKKFFKTMGWRTVGLGKFAIGTGVTLVGVAVAVWSGRQIDLESSKVVWGSLGVVVGTGVGLVGLHLMVKGGKSVFQSTKMKKTKGWTFKVS
ncbi:hypothetical protein KFE98_14300 [bacterium SCSIO 12741]|nr:hypothetical protein KFE98_14300 [bacterium SCSIO 12741]